MSKTQPKSHFASTSKVKAQQPKSDYTGKKNTEKIKNAFIKYSSGENTVGTDTIINEYMEETNTLSKLQQISSNILKNQTISSNLLSIPEDAEYDRTSPKKTSRNTSLIPTTTVRFAEDSPDKLQQI